LDPLVYREEGLECAAVLALDVGNPTGAQTGAVPDLGRLVGDVRLVEIRGLWQWLGVERVGVTRCRLRSTATVVRRVRVRLRTAGVRGRIGEAEEERLCLRRPAGAQVDSFPRPHGLAEVGGAVAVVERHTVF